MNKQNHNELFVIEVYVVLKGACEISVGFSIGVNSICGSLNDYGQLTSLNFGSFGLSSFLEKIND
jgi:hypothetical protein